MARGAGTACSSRRLDAVNAKATTAPRSPHGIIRAKELNIMPGVHDLGLFVLAGVLLNLTPGVDFLYVLGRSTTCGFIAGVWAALGIGAGCLVHITAAALGLSAILASSAAAFMVVKWVGAAYLIY